HGDINPPIQQRVLDFLREEALPLQLVERPVDVGVTARLDDHELGRHTMARECGLHPLRLPERELTATRTEPKRRHRSGSRLPHPASRFPPPARSTAPPRPRAREPCTPRPRRQHALPARGRLPPSRGRSPPPRTCRMPPPRAPPGPRSGAPWTTT